MRHRRPFDLGGGPRMAAVQRIDSSVRKPHKTPIPTPLPLTAAATVDLAAMTLSATAMSNRIADFDIVLGDLVTSATAIGGRLQASTDAMLAELTVSADALSSRTADVDTVLGAVTLSADATGSISAALDNVLADLSVSAAVSTSRTAALSSSLAPVTISAIVSSGRTMTLTEALGALSISATAHTGRVATLNTSLAALSGTAAARSSRAAALSITLGAATVIAAGTGQGVAQQLVRTINNAGTGAMPADAFWTIGQPFKKGAVPADNIVTPTLGGASVPGSGIAISRHGDGSLRWAQFLLDLSGVPIAAGASKDLVFTSVVGSWSTTTSRTNADWAALAHTVEITSLSTTSTSAADMDGAGTWIAAFNAGAGNIIEIYGQGPLGLWVTAKVPFVNGATTHRFLYAEIEYWVTQKAGGTLGPVAFRGPFIRNDLVLKADPGTFTGNIAFKRAGSTVRSETGVPNIAMAWSPLCDLGGEMEWSASNPHIWCGLQDYTQLGKVFPALPYVNGIAYTGNADNQPRTSVSNVNTSTGVLTVTPDVFALLGLGSSRTTSVDVVATVMPTGLSANTVYWAVYLLGGLTIQLYDTLAHALAGGSTGKVIPSTSGTAVQLRNCLAPTTASIITQLQHLFGARNDLSIITEWGASMIVANTQEYQRHCRVPAYAIAGSPTMVINDKTGKVPSFLNGTGAYPTPAGLIGAGQSGTTFTNTLWQIGQLFSSDIGGGAGPTGFGDTGFGVGHPNGWDPVLSHMPSPTFPIWLLEGGAIAREILYLQANNAIGMVSYLGQRNILIGGTTYYATGTMDSENRTNAWNMRAYANAAYAAPDGSVEQTYFETVCGSNAAAIAALKTYYGANYSNLGFSFYGQSDYPPTNTNWRIGLPISQYAFGYQCLAYAWADLLIGDRVAGVPAVADFVGRAVNNLFNVLCPYFATNYIYGISTSDSLSASPPTVVSSAADIGMGPGADQFFSYVNGGTDVTWSGRDPEWTLAIGDRFRPQNYTNLTVACPSAALPLSDGTGYPILSVNLGAKTFKLNNGSGSPITFTQTVNLSGGWLMPTGQSCPATLDVGDTYWDPDGYMAVWAAATALHAIRGTTGGAAAYDAASGRLNFNRPTSFPGGTYNTTSMWGYTRTP